MSLSKKEGRRFWSYGFRYKGHYFSGSTGTEDRREAERFEKRRKIEAQVEVETALASGAQMTGKKPITLDVLVGRYWQEVGQYLAAPETQWKNLDRVILHFGPDKKLTDITDADMAAFVAKRRGEVAKNKKKSAQLIQPNTVNHTTVDVVRKLFTYAREVLRIRSDNEPVWKRHKIKVHDKPIREVRPSETEAFLAELAEGFRDVYAFALASGQRRSNCLLRWSEVDLENGRISVIQKGGRPHSIPISDEMREILEAQLGHHPEWVFTFVVRQGNEKRGRRVGDRFPVTADGLKTEFRRVKEKLGLKDIRFHDLRHTRASLVLRATGNLKLAQQLLGHSDVSTTAKYYANVTANDLLSALNSEFSARKAKT